MDLGKGHGHEVVHGRGSRELSVRRRCHARPCLVEALCKVVDGLRRLGAFEKAICARRSRSRAV